MTKVYARNLARSQFEWIESLLPPAKSGGSPHTGCLWVVLNAIFCLVIRVELATLR